MGPHGVAHDADESSELFPCVPLEGTSLACSSHDDSVIITPEHVLCIVESSAWEELWDLLLGSIYNDL